MPLATTAKQNKFQRLWQSHRRRAFFVGKKCNRCGSTESLCLRYKPIGSRKANGVFGRRPAVRNSELSRTEIVCDECRRREDYANRSRTLRHGTTRGYRRGCRCDECRRAVVEANRRRLKRKK